MSPAVNPSLSNRVEELCAALTDLNCFVREQHDRLLGSQPANPSTQYGEKVSPMPQALFESLDIRMNGAFYSIDEIRSMIRTIGGRI